MKPKSLTLWSAIALLAIATACGDQKNPTNPSSTTSSSTAASSTSSTGGVSGTNTVSATAPVPVSPADGAQIKNVNQPVTLVITNAVATGAATPTYGFEVAIDAGFANKSFTKEGVAAGGSGQTSLVIDKIPAGQSYFWRAHLSLGGTAGPNSKARGFTIGPQVTLTTPVPASPGNGSTVANATLTVNNVGKQGPAGPISYLFEMSDSSSFGRILFNQTVGENGSGQTAVGVPLSAIPASASPRLYWHVRASDPSNSVTTPFSDTFSFVYQAFNLRDATMIDMPADFASWPETSTITRIDFSPDAFQVDFDRRLDQPGIPRYGDVGFGSGSLQYSLGGCFDVNGHYYCSAPVQFWFGRELTASTPPWNVGVAWFYNPARWGPLYAHQPQDGDLVGLIICPGNCRGAATQIVNERSNVALVPWVNDGFVTYTYSGGSYVSSSARAVVGRRR